MDVRSLGFRTDLGLLRFGGTEVQDHGDHLVVRSPHNPTHWWGNFLLLHQAPTVESSAAWLDRFAAVFPDAAHVAIGMDGANGDVSDLAWFAARGFTAEGQTVMTATTPPEPAQPSTGARCRQLRSDEDWSQSIELRMRCRDDSQEDPGSYRRFATAKAWTNRELVATGHGAWFGAFLDGRLVSQMGLLAAAPGLARFQSVETDPDFRRRGIARSLLHHTSRYGFEQLSAHTLVMVADPNYFAIDLYREAGFMATETQLQIERAPGR